MGAAKLLTAAGGGVILDAASTATDKTITVPADNGTLIYANSSGNVGIGTSSPSVKLDVVGNNAAVQASESGGASVRMAAGGSTGYFGTYSNHPLVFNTNSAERARIDSSGNLLVGTTSSAVDCRVHIYKTATTGDVLRVQNASGQTGVAYVSFRYGTGSGTETGYISTNGTSTTYSTSSDYRLKENVQPMTGALSVVSALKPCTYTWKSDGSTSQGFIAHELQAVVSECVTGEKDAVDADGNPKYQGIDTSFLVATLTAAIQEQQAIINAQQATLETLTARIEALENK